MLGGDFRVMGTVMMGRIFILGWGMKNQGMQMAIILVQTWDKEGEE
jgi:hypothetical protein